ncbi:hypothetical protein GCM10027418_12540 [Mariniluteicoccus endophyticus]
MIRNLFFFLLGLGTGVYATLKTQKKAREVTPESVGQKVGRQAADRGADVAKQAFAFLKAATQGAQQRTSEMLDEHNKSTGTPAS